MSDRGGQDIEEVVLSHPNHIYSIKIDPIYGLFPFHVKQTFNELRLPDEGYKEFEKIVFNLYQLFIESEAHLVEINPLALTPEKQFIAADSKIRIDDSSIYRLSDKTKRIIESQRKDSCLRKDPIEGELEELGVQFIKLDGDVGMISIGAGLALSMMDWLRKEGANPYCFIDITQGLLQSVKDPEVGLRLFSYLNEFFNKQDDVKQIFYNVIAGGADVSRIGSLFYEANKRVKLRKPVTVFSGGNGGIQTRNFLRNKGFEVYDTLSEAIENIVSLEKGV